MKSSVVARCAVSTNMMLDEDLSNNDLDVPNNLVQISSTIISRRIKGHKNLHLDGLYLT
jgi:hypothetical protein